MSPASSPSW
uniref:Uncharacterized protein n=1 Tax=Arundo donax TaxID=35708 RepID=A0A0A8YCN2_ARUDO